MASNQQSDYDELYLDEAALKSLDQIEERHSPKKAAGQSFTSVNLSAPVRNPNRIKNLTVSTSHFNPTTPKKERNPRQCGPSVVRSAFDGMSLISPSKSPTPKSSLPPLSMRKMTRNPLPRYAVSDDEEMSEVESELLDTDTDTDPFSISPFPLLSQTSMSSIDSNVEPSTSFSSCKSPTAGGTGGSPRKYRKTDPSPSKSARIEAIKDGIASRNASQTALKSPISPPKSALLKKIEDEFTSQCNTSQSPMPVSPTPLRSFSFGASSSTNASRDNLKTRLTGKSSFTAPPRPLLSTASSPSRKDPDLQKFLMQPLGQDLESCIIAHDKATVALMDRHQLSWGVQWELARGVTDRFWDWAKVHKKLEQLTGLNSEAAWKVRAVMLGRQPRASEISLWEELDREQKAIEENLGRGLGLMGAYEGKKDWYGGQIQQRARIILGDGDQLRVRLEKLEKRRSYRLARFSGSRRVLQVGVPKELVLNQNKTLKDFLRQKFVLLGRIFVPFYAKDHAVYLVETDENYERQSGNWCGDQFRRSFKDILNWHNRLDLNIDQPITKYASRNALPLSTSVPILEFADEDINFIDDIYGDWHGSGKPPAEYIKTDGCGFINELALKRIAQALDLASRPTAVQGRIEGAKGLWILHPHDHSPVPKIWIRKSQQKINYPRPRHRAHRILDLVRVSCASSSVHLSKQVIMNLSHNGVAAETLTELMREGLVEAVRPLMKWEGPQAMQLLWDEINKLSSVSRSRLTRLTAGLSRALGLEHHSWRGEVIDLEKDEEIPALEDDAGAGAYTGRGGGGAPVTLSEVTVELLQAGFHPTECRILREKLRYLVTSTINSIVEKYSIPVPQSLEAFIIPDPIGILEEGEVYYHSSVPLLNPESQTFFHVVSGELLVGRHPVRLASDIQKVTAVDRPELFAWVDVLIVSTKGRKSFASKLSGGDQDGDTLFILRERELVVPFVNKPVKPVPSTVMSEAFEKQPERVSAFAKRVSVMDPRAAQAAFVDILMGSLDDTKMGLYSSYQDYAIYEYGYEDPRAERLAYLFNAILDSSKTGDRLKKNIFEKDRKLYGKTIPTFEEAVRNTAYIFHTLQRFGQAASRDLLSEYNRLLGDNNADNADQDLLRPYNLAASRAEQTNLDISLRQILQAELKQIRDFVDAVYLDYTTMMSRLRKDTESSKKPASKSKEHGKADALKAPIHELYNRPVKDVIFLQNVEELKASYAYQYKPWFAFEVAFSTLCTLKAKASSSGLAPITRSFDEAKSIPSVYVRAVARLSDSDS